MYTSVIVISIVRLYLVVEGQWQVDGSWFYNPMLVIETAEVGATLIALSIPGLKPLLGRRFEIFNQPAIPKSYASTPLAAFGPLSTSSRGAIRLSSKDTKATNRFTARDRDARPSDSDDSLMEAGRNRS
jgi:hypothetical protein